MSQDSIVELFDRLAWIGRLFADRETKTTSGAERTDIQNPMIRTERVSQDSASPTEENAVDVADSTCELLPKQNVRISEYGVQ